MLILDKERASCHRPIDQRLFLEGRLQRRRSTMKVVNAGFLRLHYTKDEGGGGDDFIQSEWSDLDDVLILLAYGQCSFSNSFFFI